MKKLTENVFNPYQILGLLIGLIIILRYKEFNIIIVLSSIIRGILIVLPYEFNENERK